MAAVTKDSAASLNGQAAMRSQVDVRVASVEAAYAKAMEALAPSLLESGLSYLSGTDARAKARHNVEQFRDDIDAWAARGRKAADTNTSPGPKGWPGWIEVGNVHLAGLHVQAEFQHETLKNLVETAKEAPMTTVKAVREAAKAVESAGASVALGILKPVGMALGAYLLLRLVMR